MWRACTSCASSAVSAESSATRLTTCSRLTSHSSTRAARLRCRVRRSEIAKSARNEVKHPELYRTIAAYWEERRQVSSYTPMESFVHGDASLNETAALMAMNAANAIALDFRKRLYQFICFL
jgi:hypothetical protein